MMMLPKAILHVITTMALLTNMTLAPIQPEWTPSEEDVTMVSQTVWGEYRGADEEQRAAVVFCICNRVDSEQFPDSIAEVVTQPYHFQGYSPDNPSEPFADEVRNLLIQWHNGDSWLDPSLCWFSGNGKINRYRDAWKSEEATVFWPDLVE